MNILPITSVIRRAEEEEDQYYQPLRPWPPCYEQYQHEDYNLWTFLILKSSLKSSVPRILGNYAGAARYGISVGVNPKTNVGLGVPRAGTSNQKAMRNEKAFTKRLNLPPSKQALVTSTVAEEVAT